MNKLREKILVWLGIGKRKEMAGRWNVFYSFWLDEKARLTVWDAIESNEKRVDSVREELELLQKHLGVEIVQKPEQKVVVKLKKK